MRGDEGYLLALAYSTQRGYGRNHPFAAEIRSGYIDIEIVPEELGFAVNIGELLMTECEMVNGFVAPENEDPHFTRGYGLVYGLSERKAMAMALVDRTLQRRTTASILQARHRTKSSCWPTRITLRPPALSRTSSCRTTSISRPNWNC